MNDISPWLIVGLMVMFAIALWFVYSEVQDTRRWLSRLEGKLAAMTTVIGEQQKEYHDNLLNLASSIAEVLEVCDRIVGHWEKTRELGSKHSVERKSDEHVGGEAEAGPPSPEGEQQALLPLM